MIATYIITAGAGYYIGATTGPFLITYLKSIDVGAFVGSAMGLTYSMIEGSTYHNYNLVNTLVNVGSYAFVGVTTSLMGYGLGTVKFSLMEENMFPRQGEDPFEVDPINIENNNPVNNPVNPVNNPVNPVNNPVNPVNNPANNPVNNYSIQ